MPEPKLVLMVPPKRREEGTTAPARTHRVGETAKAFSNEEVPAGITRVVIGREQRVQPGVHRVVIDRDTVSRDHAEIRLTDEGWRIFDLGSTNGTFVDKQPVNPSGTLIGRDTMARVADVSIGIRIG